jgi:hypothetical protein
MGLSGLGNLATAFNKADVLDNINLGRLQKKQEDRQDTEFGWKEQDRKSFRERQNNKGILAKDKIARALEEATIKPDDINSPTPSVPPTQNGLQKSVSDTSSDQNLMKSGQSDIASYVENNNIQNTAKTLSENLNYDIDGGAYAPDEETSMGEESLSPVKESMPLEVKQGVRPSALKQIGQAEKANNGLATRQDSSLMQARKMEQSSSKQPRTSAGKEIGLASSKLSKTEMPFESEINKSGLRADQAKTNYATHVDHVKKMVDYMKNRYGEGTPEFFDSMRDIQDSEFNDLKKSKDTWQAAETEHGNLQSAALMRDVYTSLLSHGYGTDGNIRPEYLNFLDQNGIPKKMVEGSRLKNVSGVGPMVILASGVTIPPTALAGLVAGKNVDEVTKSMNEISKLQYQHTMKLNEQEQKAKFDLERVRVGHAMSNAKLTPEERNDAAAAEFESRADDLDEKIENIDDEIAYSLKQKAPIPKELIDTKNQLVAERDAYKRRISRVTYKQTTAEDRVDNNRLSAYGRIAGSRRSPQDLKELASQKATESMGGKKQGITNPIRIDSKTNQNGLMGRPSDLDRLGIR